MTTVNGPRKRDWFCRRIDQTHHIHLICEISVHKLNCTNRFISFWWAHASFGFNTPEFELNTLVWCRACCSTSSREQNIKNLPWHPKCRFSRFRQFLDNPPLTRKRFIFHIARLNESSSLITSVEQCENLTASDLDACEENKKIRLTKITSRGRRSNEQKNFVIFLQRKKSYKKKKLLKT